MMEQILYYVHYALLLLFGITVSAAFSGICVSRENIRRLFLLALLCGGLQIGVYGLWGEAVVWELYPVITHLPIILALRIVFGKTIPVAVAATTSAYLCCQPAKWIGLFSYSLSQSTVTELLVRILILLTTAGMILHLFSESIAGIYSRKHRSSWVFGIIPVVYYLFDYLVAIYSSLWADNHQLVIEFLPMFLCFGYLFFCSAYYREYDQKSEAERKEQLLRITVEQQMKEVEMIRRSEAETRRLRHDLRLFLNSLSSCVAQSDVETAQKLIAGFSDRAEASSVRRYCGSDTLNYVLSDYAAQCREKGIRFHTVIDLPELPVDEMLLSTIVVNALDNALNAQESLPSDRKTIRLMLKNSGGKTLLCIKNSFAEKPLFHNGTPVTTRKGHGNGAVSIQYATEKLGGNCRFYLEEDYFVLQVVV